MFGSWTFLFLCANIHEIKIMAVLYYNQSMSIENLSDEELIVKIREKDPELYAEIIQRYQSKLSHYLRKFIKDFDEIEDVLQDVFIKAYKNLYGFNPDKRFSSWIYRIAHNEAINHIKKYYNRGRISFDELEYEIIGEKMDLAERIDLKIDREKIGLAFNDLKLKYKEVILLYYFEDRSYEEISDILRMPVSTVGTYISRGKKQLKEILLKKYGREK
ncbi:MAG: hypothetical protein A2373_03300 [Candidatus Magasanikbacteria bacterium RIFOXYB1_FULL_40_15]|uniref:RNA polymerase sigma factor n=1 Tax=Candidatus Magasanikbacteria bacterium RIFOXYB1_FULL_40_15 TaxID=1798697 RepID=A0A1F6NF89_9BACT|nr:MAG: hypothetical protein A2373_03300 [Candidatus Magasanikbacteria bacterium RIFOXYB1_FULL_40_15]